MSDKLKPCPFCGTEPRLCVVSDVLDKFSYGYTISCDTCGIEMNDEYRDEVTKSWNRRARPARAALSARSQGEVR